MRGAVLFLWPQVPCSCTFSSTSLVDLLIVWGGRNSRVKASTMLWIPTAPGKWWASLEAGLLVWSSWNMASSGVKAGILSFWGDTNKMSSGGAPISFHDVRSPPPLATGRVLSIVLSLTPTLSWRFFMSLLPLQAQWEAWDWSGTNSNKFLRQRRS